MSRELIKEAIHYSSYSDSLQRQIDTIPIASNAMYKAASIMPALADVIVQQNTDITIWQNNKNYAKFNVSTEDFICGKSITAMKLRESASFDFLKYRDQEKYRQALSNIDQLFNFSSHYLSVGNSIHKELKDINNDWNLIKRLYFIHNDHQLFKQIEINTNEYRIVFEENEIRIIINNPIGTITEIFTDRREIITRIQILDTGECASVSNYLHISGDFEIFMKAYNKLYEFLGIGSEYDVNHFQNILNDFVNTNQIEVKDIINYFTSDKISQDENSLKAKLTISDLCNSSESDFIHITILADRPEINKGFRGHSSNGLPFSIFLIYENGKLKTNNANTFTAKGLFHEYESSPGLLYQIDKWYSSIIDVIMTGILSLKKDKSKQEQTNTNHE